MDQPKASAPWLGHATIIMEVNVYKSPPRPDRDADDHQILITFLLTPWPM